MTRPLILVDQALPIAAQRLAAVADVRPFVGRDFGPDTPDLDDAAAVVVRSVSRVDAAALAAGRRLRIVASATIGVDHVDTAAAARRGVRVARAPGCNAPGVADWVVAAVVADAARRGLPLAGRTLAVVGAGQTGRAVLARAAALGLEVRACDPPREEREARFRGVRLRDALTADIVSLHVPRTARGACVRPTEALLGAAALACMRPAALLVNAARGGLVEEAALRAALADLAAGPAAAALDVFAGEPRPAPDTVAVAFRATPHIAGATIEGKRRAQLAAAAAVEAALGLPGPAPAAPDLAAVARTVAVRARPGDPEAEAVAAADALLRAMLPLAETEAGLRDLVARNAPFDGLRDAHRRHELGAWTVAIEGRPAGRTRAVIEALGFARTTAAHPNLTVRVD